jgi:hypothetical protein
MIPNHHGLTYKPISLSETTTKIYSDYFDQILALKEGSEQTSSPLSVLPMELIQDIIFKSTHPKINRKDVDTITGICMRLKELFRKHQIKKERDSLFTTANAFFKLNSNILNAEDTLEPIQAKNLGF